MDFKKKMKTRLYVSITYCILGIALVSASTMNQFQNHFTVSYGLALIVIGILRIAQNRKITKDDKTMRHQELTEADERNRMLSERAKSWTFSFTIIVSGLIVTILSFLGYHDEAMPFSWFVCFMITAYWIFRLIAGRKY